MKNTVTMHVRSAASAFLLSGLVLAAVHCGGGDDSAAPGGNGGDAGIGGDGGTGSETSTGEGGGGGGITVDGFVLDGSQAYAGRAVVLLDANGTRIDVTTGADGSFHAENVATPYDAFVASVDSDGGAGPSPSYYAGLSRKDPVLSSTDYSHLIATSLRTGSIYFTIALNTNDTMYVSTPQGNVTEIGTGASKKYVDFSIGWIGDVTFTTDVHFFIATDGVFEAYLDKKDVVLHDTQATDLGTLTGFTTFVGTPKTTVTQTVPAGYTAVQTRMVLIGADGSIVAHGESATDTLTTFFPPLANIRVQLEGAASGPNAEGTLTQLAFPDYSAVPSSVTLQEQPMPTGLAPADNATGIAPATQKLGWTGGASPATFAIGLAAVGQPTITILTSGSSFDLAKLATVGFSLQPATAYKWSVRQSSDVAMDDAVAPGAKPYDVPANVPWVTGSTNVQTFTTQ